MRLVKTLAGYFVLILALLSGFPVSGENLYLRAGATGSENGQNWNDAWSSVANVQWGQGPGKVSSGDTLWVGAGTYGKLDLSFDGGAGVISIQRANIEIPACTQALGWISTFDDRVIIEFINASTVGIKYKLAFKQNWFVTPDGTGNRKGINWENAFAAANLNWENIHGGDSIYLSSGLYDGFKINKSGNGEDSRISIRAGQDTGHNGVVTISGGINLAAQNYVTIDGEMNGARHIKLLGSIQASRANSFFLKHLEISTPGIGIVATYGAGGRVSNCYLHDIQEEAGIQFNARNYQVSGYDQTLVDNTVFQLNRFEGSSGNGPDGIQGCWGLTVSNCLFTNIVGAIQGGQHQDYVQMMANYVKIVGNRFLGSADSCLDYDAYNGQPAHHLIYNNEFILVRGGGIRYYASGGAVFSSMSDVHIFNNTFVDHVSGHQWAFSIANIFGGSLAVADVSIQNNLFYNCISPVYIEAAELATQSNYSFDYNLINAGASGNTTVIIDGSDYTQVHPFGGTPVFVGYVGGNEASNLRLAAGDLAAKDKGTSLATYFITDKNGVVRPQGPAWDIGAHEFQLTP